MPRGEKLLKFLASLMLHNFYGVVIIRMEAGKVTHVDIETRRTWQYKDLPGQIEGRPVDARQRQASVPG